MPTLVSPAHHVLLIAAAAFVAAIALTPLVSRLALARGWLLPEDGARLGRRAVVPRVGGLAVVGAFGAALLVLPPFDTWLDGGSGPATLPLVAAAALLAALGLPVEDVRGVPRQLVAATQLVAVLLLVWSGYRVEDLAVPFWRDVPLGALSLPFTVVWMLAMVNVFDLVHGVDGLVGGLALVATIALLGAAAAGERWGEVGALAAVAGALAGFVRFNYHPARVFLGRCGSRPIGLVLAAVAVSGRLKSPATLAAVVPLLALVLPLLDVALPSGERPRCRSRLVLVSYGLAVAFATMTLVLTEGPPLALSALAAVLLLVAGVAKREEPVTGRRAGRAGSPPASRRACARPATPRCARSRRTSPARTTSTPRGPACARPGGRSASSSYTSPRVPDGKTACRSATASRPSRPSAGPAAWCGGDVGARSSCRRPAGSSRKWWPVRRCRRPTSTPCAS